MLDKHKQRKRRHARVRVKISGTPTVPRVSVFRSNRHIFVQLIDDSKGKTILSNKIGPAGSGTKTQRAVATGETIAKEAKSKGIAKVIFDRGGYKYHGRVKALAEGLRKGGLKM